jgi:hypothetical protein
MQKMQVISTRTHGYLDFLTVGFALAFPRVLNCSRRFANAVTTLALGKLAYALMTRHEMGLKKVIPMKTHLFLDAIGGATLAALPYMLDEDNEAAKNAALGMGVFDIVAGPFTQTRAPFDRPQFGAAAQSAPESAAEPAAAQI